MAVTITQGKTHSKHARLLLDGNNASGDARTATVGLSYSNPDFTGWSDDPFVYLPGRGTMQFGPLAALFNNKASAAGVNEGAYETLKGQSVAIGTVVIGIGEAPTIGAPAFSADVEQLQATVDVGGDNPVLLSADFSAPDAVDAGWGAMLAVGTSVSSTTTNGSVDNGASSTNGYDIFVHVAQSAGAMGTNNWAITVEHSTDDGAWATLDTATLDGSAVGAEKLSGTGTVNRYTRAVLTKTAGTDLIAWVHLVRK